MKITKLEVRNFIGIEETSIDPKKLNIISGRNGKGKTSLIEAIKAAFRGAGQDKIRVGESKAEIFLATDDIEIKRSITAKGTNVTVTRDGKVLPKPQTFLDGIIGDFSFEPVKFFAMSAKEQTQYLLKAIPVKATLDQLKAWTGGLVDFASLEKYTAQHGLEAVDDLTELLYQERAGVNMKVKQLEGAAAELKAKLPAGVKPEDTDGMAAVVQQLSEGRAAQQRMEELGRRVEQLNADVHDLEEQISGIEDRISAKRIEAEKLQGEMVAIDVPDIAELQTRFAAMQKAQNFLRDFERLEDMRTEYKEVHKRAEGLDQVVKTLQKEAPAELMGAAAMPVEGLAFAEGSFTLNGVPIQNLSTSEKARLAVAVTRNLNAGYDVKAICLDGFESLDTETQKAFLAQAQDDDFQYFITKVADLDKVNVTTHD